MHLCPSCPKRSQVARAEACSPSLLSAGTRGSFPEAAREDHHLCHSCTQARVPTRTRDSTGLRRPLSGVTGADPKVHGGRCTCAILALNGNRAARDEACSPPRCPVVLRAISQRPPVKAVTCVTLALSVLCRLEPETRPVFAGH
jgi:hypothetical protein